MFFSSFGGGASRPRYNHVDDSIDLQIKSLLYVFKRLRINKLASFYCDPKNSSLKYADNSRYDDDQQLKIYYEKLDKTYNIEVFKENILLGDEYRAMVDYGKNKFRSLCIVFDYPSVNLSRPGSPVKGESNTTNTDGFPAIVDYKDRAIKNYEFLLVSPKATVDLMIHTLAYSQLYIEHIRQLPYSTRHQYAKECIEEEIQGGVFTEVQLTKIIEKFLKKLAFNIQLSRIYEEYIRQLLPQRQSASSSQPVQANPGLRSVPSMNNVSLGQSSRSTSPTRTLKSKPSISKLRLGELYSLSAPPPLPSPVSAIASNANNSVTSISSSTESFPEKKIGVEIRFDIWDKCKLAVTEKLNREKRLIEQERR